MKLAKHGRKLKLYASLLVVASIGTFLVLWLLLKLPPYMALGPAVVLPPVVVALLIGWRGGHKSLWPEGGHTNLEKNIYQYLDGIYSAPVTKIVNIIMVLLIGGYLPMALRPPPVPDTAAHFMDVNGMVEIGVDKTPKDFLLKFVNRGAKRFAPFGSTETVISLQHQEEWRDGRWEDLGGSKRSGSVSRPYSETPFLDSVVIAFDRTNGDTKGTGEAATFKVTFKVPQDFKLAESVPRRLKFWFQVVLGDQREADAKDLRIPPTNAHNSIGYLEVKILPEPLGRTLEDLERSPLSGSPSVPGIPEVNWKEEAVIALFAEKHVSGFEVDLGEAFTYKVPADGVYRCLISGGAWTPGPLQTGESPLYAAGGVFVENSGTLERVLLSEQGIIPWRFASSNEAEIIAASKELRATMVLREGDLLRFWLYSPVSPSQPEGSTRVTIQRLDMPGIPEIMSPLLFPSSLRLP